MMNELRCKDLMYRRGRFEEGREYSLGDVVDRRDAND